MSELSEPATRQQYEARYHENLRITGVGMHVAMHMPCPFCAAPDFMAWEVLAVADVMAKGAVCNECHRGIRAEYVQTQDVTTYEVVQTCGPEPPAWSPTMRRVDR